MPIRPLSHVSLVALLAVALVTGCGEPPDRSDGGWTLNPDATDTDTADTTPDTDEPPDCPEGRACLPDVGTNTDTTDTPDTTPDCDPGYEYSPATGECVRSDPRDVGLPGDDVIDPEDTSSPTTIGQEFDGPEIVSEADIPIAYDHAVGLHWQSALSKFDAHAIHRHLPDRPVVHLSAITSRGGNVNPAWSLPEELPESRHFYHNYCEEAGSDQCASEGIDDDRATFALIMVSLMEAPDDGVARDCTYGQIRGKRTCHYGRSVAPLPDAMILYAYRPFNTGDYPVFDGLNIPATDLQAGYHLVILEGFADEMAPQVRSLTFWEVRPEMMAFGSSRMFPLLYP